MSQQIDFNTLRKANVYLRDKIAGHLEKLENGQFKFEYDSTWPKDANSGIGLNLPVKDSPYISKILFPFFDNLIPEGWLLSYAEQIYKIDKRNRFALLLATGKETIGAVRVVAIDESGKEVQREGIEKDEELKKNFVKYPAILEAKNDRCPYCLKVLAKNHKQEFHPACAKKMWGTTRKLFVSLDKDEPLASFKRTIYGASISGAQRKGLFTFENGALIPTYKRSQFILKPQGAFSSLPENEHITMAIAKEVGFNIPPFTIFEISGLGKIFAIKRFDIAPSGEQLRLEDAAQALELPSDDKYNSSYERLSKAVKSFSDTQVVDLFEMWKRIIFSYFIANGDMHLKNWSFLERDNMKGIFRLSPCYDFLNTRLPIPDEEGDLALTLNAKKNKLKRTDFLQFAKQLEIEDKLVEEVMGQIDNWWKVTQDFIPNSFLEPAKQTTYLDIVEKRYQILKG